MREYCTEELDELEELLVEHAAYKIRIPNGHRGRVFEIESPSDGASTRAFINLACEHAPKLLRAFRSRQQELALLRKDNARLQNALDRLQAECDHEQWKNVSNEERECASCGYLEERE